ncbi:hypothetical protein DKX38_027064 [Salix brachista]|uniref:Uncharacterized protein n=1 Tax=Salix brachista TaxID=2182728 RepID=A0A5N5JCV4_9ROSI|nr:hypothetical protein DKX38_027064 [Salix brachista]
MHEILMACLARRSTTKQLLSLLPLLVIQTKLDIQLISVEAKYLSLQAGATNLVSGSNWHTADKNYHEDYANLLSHVTDVAAQTCLCHSTCSSNTLKHGSQSSFSPRGILEGISVGTLIETEEFFAQESIFAIVCSLSFVCGRILKVGQVETQVERDGPRAEIEQLAEMS